MQSENKMKVLILICLAHSSLGYKWQRVEKGEELPSDMVQHFDKTGGLRGVCRNVLIGGGRLDPDALCHGTMNGFETAINPSHYDVLFEEPMKEKMVWKETYDANLIRSKGVVVKEEKYPTPSMYVCALPLAGVGKLVIWSDNDITCSVGFGFELKATKNFQVLLTEEASKYELKDVRYDLDELSVMSVKPVHLARATLINRDDREQTVTHSLEYSKTSSSSWESSFEFSLGTSVEVEAGIPNIVESTWEISASSTYAYSYGKSEETSIEVSLEASVKIPARHRCKVRIDARQKVINVPYEGQVTSHFTDGTSRTVTMSGIYDGVSVSDDSVKIEKCYPIRKSRE